MKILVDLQSCQSGSKFGGIGRYSWNLFEAMVKNASQHDFHVLMSNLMPENSGDLYENALKILPAKNIHTFKVAPHVYTHDPENRFRSQWAEIIRERYIQAIKPDALHISSLIEGLGDDVTTSVKKYHKNTPTAVTLYDLIPLVNQENYLKDEGTRTHYLNKIEEMKRADLLLAISDYSRTEGEHFLPQSKDRIVNISSAANPFFTQTQTNPQEEENLRCKYGIKGDFLLYTASFDQRKNHERLIKSFAKLPNKIRSELQLVIVGKGWPGIYEQYHQLSKQRGLAANDVIFTGAASDQELLALYNLCKLFVFPSLSEGFGLPILEAMSCGAPAIGSKTTSIIEVIGRNDALFDPESIDSITSKITEAIVDDGFRNELKRHALSHAKKFSWDASAKKAISAIESMINSYQHGINHPEESLSESCIKNISSLPSSKSASNEDIKRAAYAVLQLEIKNTRLNRSSTKEPNIGFITTWNTRCGIASYSSHLINNLPVPITVFAPHAQNLVAKEDDFVRRCWHSEADDLTELEQSIAEAGVDVLVIQFNYGFFEFGEFSRFIFSQIQNGTTIILTMHSTADITPIYPEKDLRRISCALSECQSIFVHAQQDITRLQCLGVSNAKLFPHGILDFKPSPKDHDNTKPFVVSSYGFFLPHKGLSQLIDALSILLNAGEPVALKMYNAEYPADVSRIEIEAAQRKIKKLGLEKSIELNTSYLDDIDCLNRLAEADLIVFPYQNTGESSSAAARYGLASGNPVAVTPLEIFDDISPATLILPGTTPKLIADGLKTIIREIRSDSDYIKQYKKTSAEWISNNRYSHAAKLLISNINTSYSID